MNPKNDTFALASIAILSIIALICGFLLASKGYTEGTTFATIGSSGLSGIVGYIGGKASGKLDNQTLSIQSTPPTAPEPKKE